MRVSGPNIVERPVQTDPADPSHTEQVQCYACMRFQQKAINESKYTEVSTKTLTAYCVFLIDDDGDCYYLHVSQL